MRNLRIATGIAIAVVVLHGCGGGGSGDSGTTTAAAGTGAAGTTATSGAAGTAGGTGAAAGTGTTGTTGTTAGTTGSTGTAGTTGTTGSTLSAGTAVAPGTYRLAGRATGLDSPITLKNSDGQTLTVTPAGASSAFSFGTGLTPGSSYKVSIASLPTKQNCTLTNAEGVVPTADVVSVSVACTTRAWTIGQQLESDDTNVVMLRGGIDQSGRVTAMYVKSSGPGANSAIYATRGTPGSAGATPQWTTPVRVDTAATAFFYPYIFSSRQNAMAVSQNGHAHIAWISVAPCNGSTFSTTGTCAYIYSSTRTPDSDTWTAPVLVADTPNGSFGNAIHDPLMALINNQGDAVIWFGGYKLVPPSTTVVRTALATRPAGSAAFKVSILDDFPDTSVVQVVLDKTGGIVAAAERPQSNSSNKDMKVYVGNVSAGVTATIASVVDQLASDISFDSLHSGSTGDALLLWKQNDGSGVKQFAAVKAFGSTTWSAPAIVTSLTTTGIAVVTDSGLPIYYTGCNRFVRDQASNTWALKLPALPTNCTLPTSDAVMASDGSYMSLGFDWITYNQSDNTMSRLPNATLSVNDYLLGFFKSWGSNPIRLFTRTLDGNYVGAYLALAEFDTLPTPTATSGIGRNGITNAWGFFFK